MIRILILFSVLLSTSFVANAAKPPAPRAQLSPGLASKLLSDPKDEFIEIILEIDGDIVFTKKAQQEIDRLNDDREAQEVLIERTCRARAPKVFQLIDETVNQGGGVGYFWFLNRLALRVPVSIAKKLANAKGVKKMYFSRPNLNEVENGLKSSVDQGAATDQMLDRILTPRRKFVVLDASYDEVQKGAISGWSGNSPEDHYIDLKEWIDGGWFYFTNPDGLQVKDWWYIGPASLKGKSKREYRFVAEGLGQRGQMRGTITLTALDKNGDKVLMRFVREDLDKNEVRSLTARCESILTEK